MKKFIINEHGVCTNPLQLFKFEKDRYMVKFSICSNGELWTHSYTINLHNSSSSFGCSFSWLKPKTSKTKQETIDVGIESLLTDLDSKINGSNTKDSKLAMSFYRDIHAFQKNQNQQELF